MDKFKIWLIAVGLIFFSVQLYQWLQSILLPLPIYIFGGAFLSIASNLKQLKKNDSSQSIDTGFDNKSPINSD